MAVSRYLTEFGIKKIRKLVKAVNSIRSKIMLVAMISVPLTGKQLPEKAA
jgi:hypothetical protein